jgi:hypothetical protein
VVYKIVANRENETVTCERSSLSIAVAKARVWTNERWQVIVIDGDGRTLDPAEFDKLLAA